MFVISIKRFSLAPQLMLRSALFLKEYESLTLFRMSLFGASHEWGSKKYSLPKICHTYPTIMKLDTVVPYLKKIQKKYKSRDTVLEFC